MYDSEVQLTDKPDMFTMDDEKGGQRAEMPCGHAVGRQLFSKNVLNVYKILNSNKHQDSKDNIISISRLIVVNS